MKSQISKKIICIITVIVFCFILISPVFAIDAPEPQAPNISLPIPGFVGFSQVKVEVDGESKSISIPWIGEYVNAIYSFVLAIAGGLASFMFIVAGFQYVVAHGDKGKIAKATKRMTNSLIGLFLTFGAYLILYTINPELTSFKSIRLDVIKREEMDFGELLTTTSDTGTAGASSGTNDENTTNTPFTSTYSECPVVLNNTDSGPIQVSQRSIEFIRAIVPVITGTTNAEKIAQVGEAAVRCGIQFGSCGKTTAVISTTALEGTEAGLQCYNNPRERGACINRRTVVGINQTQLNWARTIACCSGASECGNSNPPACCNASGGCTSNADQAKRTVRERFNNELGSGGWPDAWANQLQAGDEVVIYNGNSSYGSSHSVTFLGWEGTNGRATIIQSSWGNPTRTSITCLKSTCSGGSAPIITRITRPQ
jgi:hypothetical protein